MHRCEEPVTSATQGLRVRYSRAQEQLYLAVEGLATSDVPLAARVESAYVRIAKADAGLGFDLPPEALSRWDQVVAVMDDRRDRLTDADVLWLAQSILSMHSAVCRHVASELSGCGIDKLNQKWFPRPL